MIVSAMTPEEVYKEIEKDQPELSDWWLKKREMQIRIAKYTIKLPRSTWFEFESKRRNRYLVISIIMGRNYNNDGLTSMVALQKMERGWAVYFTRFLWQRIATKEVILPHVFDRYADPDRGNVNKTGIELIKHFIERNACGEPVKGDKLSGRSVRYKGRDNLCACVKEGVLLGEMVNEIFVAHTFITYDMATGLQKEVFEQNKEKVLSHREVLDKMKKIYDF